MDGAAISQLRASLGWSQGRLGSAIRVSALTVSRWEKGLTQPDAPRKKRLAALESRLQPASGLTRIRPIQYLGSKLRLLDQIVERVQEVAPKAERVCDLFSGSGVVARALADRYQVTAVDVQEFASVLASGLLRGSPVQEGTLQVLMRKPGPWTEVFGELISYEEKCLQTAAAGDARPLAELTEKASLAAFATGGTQTPAPLAELLQSAVERAASMNAKERQRMALPWYYGGTYFSYSQACELAAIDGHLVDSGAPAGEAMVAQAALLRTASEIVGTVGKQFAQPMRLTRKDGAPKALLVTRLLADRARSVPACFAESVKMLSLAAAPAPNVHRVKCGDFATVLADPKIKFDCVYADPPYTIDHYSRFYHVLETIARRDTPALATGKKGDRQVILRGLYRVDRLQSDFCIPKKAPAAFERLFRGVAKRGVPLVLSYSPFAESRPRLQSLETLRKQARCFFRSVDVVEATPHLHRKLNARDRNVDAPERSEVFILCRNPHGQISRK